MLQYTRQMKCKKYDEKCWENYFLDNMTLYVRNCVASSNKNYLIKNYLILSHIISNDCSNKFTWCSNRPDRVAQLAEHWASIAKVVGSIPTVAGLRAYFSSSPGVDIHSE